MQPGLTSIYQSETEIAEIAFDLLNKMIKKEFSISTNCTKIVQAEIVYSESC